MPRCDCCNKVGHSQSVTAWRIASRLVEFLSQAEDMLQAPGYAKKVVAIGFAQEGASKSVPRCVIVMFRH